MTDVLRNDFGTVHEAAFEPWKPWRNGLLAAASCDRGWLYLVRSGELACAAGDGETPAHREAAQDFLARHEERFEGNVRMAMAYRNWNRMAEADRKAVRAQAAGPAGSPSRAAAGSGRDTARTTPTRCARRPARPRRAQSRRTGQDWRSWSATTPRPPCCARAGRCPAGSTTPSARRAVPALGQLRAAAALD